MVIFDDNVKQLCVKVCKELGRGDVYWADYRGMVEDWLVTEAFSRVRSQYWDEQNRIVKASVSIVGEGSKM